MEMSDRLTTLRKSMGINQIPFAKLIGASQSAYANYERGATAIPINLVVQICIGYRISADWLLLGEGAMKRTGAGQLVEEAVLATRKHIVENRLTLPPEKEARLVRYLTEEMNKNDNYSTDDHERFLKAAI